MYPTILGDTKKSDNVNGHLVLVFVKVSNCYIWENGNMLLFLSDVHLKIFSLLDYVFSERSRNLLKCIDFVLVLH